MVEKTSSSFAADPKVPTPVAVVTLRKERAALTFHLITTLVALNEVNRELENMLLNSRGNVCM